MGRYFNPYTDFGFKKLFGEEASKELLIDFLNQPPPPRHQIADARHSPGTQGVPRYSLYKRQRRALHRG
uniref:PD-(D/E)XK nuclease family transposase n=1 Tax=Candidatus Kentrum sp. TC TaxID=2126339 RepID=A0A451A4M2_9GAMM|nr:MAG: PD-(D/E)XK nuclease family transposase [Candidatus Kentron sp. TC]